MFNLQGSEIIVILLLALVILGPEKLPDAIRRFTRTYGELKKMGSGFQSELKSALDEPMREMRETADVMREAADPTRLMADGDDTGIERDVATAEEVHGEMPADEQSDDAVERPDDAVEQPVDAVEQPVAPVESDGREHEPNAGRPEEPIEPGSPTVSVPDDPPDGHDRDEPASA